MEYDRDYSIFSITSPSSVLRSFPPLFPIIDLFEAGLNQATYKCYNVPPSYLNYEDHECTVAKKIAPLRALRTN